ncbi:MAG: alpha/beta hydrolase [Bacteroidota bacterium]|nr:alpha/beta hydrolase [Bacteroidota bacterium]
MKHLYCISGFGADERVFANLNFSDYNVHFIPWLIPDKKESLSDYTKRMAESIDEENPVLLGLSFGGIICIEIAKLIKTDKVILISSIASYREKPLWMSLTGKSRLHKIFPLRSFRLFEPIQNYNLGITNRQELVLVREYRKNISPQYTNWAVDQIVNWKNDWQPANLFHIHGTKDNMFPIKKIKADYIIKGGGHFMIMNKAVEISKVLNTILKT